MKHSQAKRNFSHLSDPRDEDVDDQPEQRGDKNETRAVWSESLAQSTNDEKISVCNTLASLLYGVHPDTLEPRIRHLRQINEARQLGMYLVNICLGVNYDEIARICARDRSTVRYSIERVEERRENPLFDLVLVAMETLIGCLVDREVVEIIENGLQIDHDLIAYMPNDEDA